MRQGLVIIFPVLCLGIVRAQKSENRDVTPKYSNEFLNIGVSARSFGMGSTAISSTKDVTSGYWNPAGLNNLDSDYQFALMHSSYFGGLANYDYIGFATLVDDLNAISLSVIRFSIDDIPDTRLLVDVNGAINYDNIQFFASSDYGFLLSYARELPFMGGLDFGGNLKVIHRTVGSFSKAWGFGLDFGAQTAINDWELGVMAKDILGTFTAWSHNASEFEDIYALTGNEIPLNSLELTLPRLLLGISRKLSFTANFGILASTDLELTFDGRRNTIIKSDFASIDPKIGLEFDFKKMIFLRFGANQLQQIKDFDGTKSWSFQPNMGLGISFGELAIDYALTDIGNLAPGLFSHVFSLKVDFNVEN